MLTLPEEETADTYSSVLYYKVEDIEGVCERLKARKVAFDGEPHKIADMGDHALWMAFFKDSEANILALMEEKPINQS